MTTRMDRKQKAVPSVHIKNLVILLEDLGVAPDHVLAQTELTQPMLQDPELMISYEEQLQIFSNGATLSPVADLGVRLGREHHINHFGIYGYAVQTCANYDQALRLTCRYLRLAGVSYDIDLMVEDDVYRIVVTDRLSLIGAHRLFMEELIFSMHGTGNEIIEGHLQFNHVAFDFPKNDCEKLYTGLLKCPVYFDKPYTEIVIDRKFGDLPLKHWDPQTSTVCAEQCEKILRRLNVGDSFADKVRDTLMQLPCNQRQAEVVAERMHVSTRHLRRKLNDEDITFQKVLNEIRCELAKEYLTHTNLPLDEVAQLLGFSETSNFRRAFIKWMEMSPAQYRERTAHAAAVN